jgi:membrane fusion protein (multidrug efflux system)
MAEDQFVFRVVDDKAVMTKVVLGERVGNEVEIVDGLKAGDVVVTDGVLKIRDGSPVSILQLPAGES